MANRSRHKCTNCGHSSAVKSNFKFSSNGKPYCNSKLRISCEDARQYENSVQIHVRKPPAYNVMEKW